MLPFILFLIGLTAVPSRVVCPVDGTVVGWTGRTREVQGKTQCQYQHVWMHYRGDLLVDEPHEFWQDCTLEVK